VSRRKPTRREVGRTQPQGFAGCASDVALVDFRRAEPDSRVEKGSAMVVHLPLRVRARIRSTYTGESFRTARRELLKLAAYRESLELATPGPVVPSAGIGIRPTWNGGSLPPWLRRSGRMIPPGSAVPRMGFTLVPAVDR
jgi:hypothetical protein